jgi:hypothetical protein
MWNRPNKGASFKPRSEYMRRDGKKTREWNRVRRQLKCQFVGMGVTTCELNLPGCMVDNGLGFAHALKRRHITNDEDMRRVILACNFCHNVLELNGEAKMSRIVDSIITKRN